MICQQAGSVPCRSYLLRRPLRPMSENVFALPIHVFSDHHAVHIVSKALQYLVSPCAQCLTATVRYINRIPKTRHAIASQESKQSIRMQCNFLARKGCPLGQVGLRHVAYASQAGKSHLEIMRFFSKTARSWVRVPQGAHGRNFCHDLHSEHLPQGGHYCNVTDLSIQEPAFLTQK